MKTLLALLCFGVGMVRCFAQNDPAPLSEEDRTGLFKLGTVIGKTAAEIAGSSVFGTPGPFTRVGHYGLPICIDFSASRPSPIPYTHEFGFFADGKAAYVIYAKGLLERAREINDAEVEGLLRKMARGGEWKVQTGQFQGTAYIYTHEIDKQKFEILAFRNSSKKALIVYHPNVTPNLNGPGGLGGLAYEFSDGQRIVWADGEEATVTAYIDAKAPSPDFAARFAAQPSEEMLETLKTTIGKFTAEQKIALFNKKSFDDFKIVTKYFNASANGKLPNNALDELKDITVWGAPLKVENTAAAKDVLEGAKWDLLNRASLVKPMEPFASPQ